MWQSRHNLTWRNICFHCQIKLCCSYSKLSETVNWCTPSCCFGWVTWAIVLWFFCQFSLINRAVVWCLGPVHLINWVILGELPALFEGSSKKYLKLQDSPGWGQRLWSPSFLQQPKPKLPGENASQHMTQMLCNNSTPQSTFQYNSSHNSIYIRKPS